MPHSHRVYVEGCFRCELSREEAERPEERDSLAEIEKALSIYEDLKNARGVFLDSVAYDRLTSFVRILINEVKELRDHAGRFRAYINLPGGWKERVAALEAEVKELREENARLGHATSQTQMFKREQELNTRIKQVEEALRESERNLSEIVRGYEFRSTDEMLRWVRTQLSPSDTEEEP